MRPLEPRIQRPGFSLGEPSKVKNTAPRESEDSAGLVFVWCLVKFFVVASDSAPRSRPEATGLAKQSLHFTATRHYCHPRRQAEDLSGSYAR
ncbi:protein of unknown function [Hyphomicrobium sp. MC1]|nr:protein of unknown function [Hyphomicrobium sp. MC1]